MKIDIEGIVCGEINGLNVYGKGTMDVLWIRGTVCGIINQKLKYVFNENR
jgi:hypothetical protein